MLNTFLIYNIYSVIVLALYVLSIIINFDVMRGSRGGIQGGTYPLENHRVKGFLSNR